MVPVLATTRSLGPLLSVGLASKFSATTETFLSGETFRIFRSPVAVRKMWSESSIQSPPGPSLVATARYCLAPSLSDQAAIPLKVPRDVKYRVPLESTAGPSVLPQLLSDAIRVAAITGVAAISPPAFFSGSCLTVEPEQATV